MGSGPKETESEIGRMEVVGPAFDIYNIIAFKF